MELGVQSIQFVLRRPAGNGRWIVDLVTDIDMAEYPLDGMSLRQASARMAPVFSHINVHEVYFLFLRQLAEEPDIFPRRVIFRESDLVSDAFPGYD